MGLEKLWRDRLARNLRAFRKARGRWPDKDIVAAAKRGIRAAVEMGIRPPYEH